MDAKTLTDKRMLLEHLFLEGLLWGIANPEAFDAWYEARAEQQIERLPAYRQADLTVDALPDLPGMQADSEEILRNYERDVGPLPAIPERLLADARALGRQVFTVDAARRQRNKRASELGRALRSIYDDTLREDD